jgi:hypothetical protein
MRIRGCSERRERGIALVIAMICIIVLAGLTAIFAYSMKVETKLAQNGNSEVELYWMGRSGVEYAKAFIALQAAVANEPYHSLNQKWAGGPGSTALSNSPLAELSLDNVELGNGTFSVKITDLDRKVNINRAGFDALEQAFRLMGVDAGEMGSLAGCIQDWIDQDEDENVNNGAESRYYQSLEPPYYSKNAPIDDLSELMLIRGISQDIYWGGVASNHPPARFQSKFGSSANFRQFRAEEIVYPVGLHDLFTPMSSGKVNINTASLMQLQMIPGVDESAAAEIIRMRSGPDGADGTEDDTPFINPGEALGPILGGATAQAQQFCTVRSAVFEVLVTAQIAGYKREYVAIIGGANPQGMQVLSFYWK